MVKLVRGVIGEMNPTDRLVELLLAGDKEQAVREAKSLLNDGMDIEQVITEGLEAAMLRLDAKCTVDQYNLLEIMLCGRAAMGVITELFPADKVSYKRKGTVVLASLEGDIHDLGKNMVKMILTATGYRVVDCGKDCPVDKLVNTAEAEGADAVGVSGLITTIIPQVRRVKDSLTQNNFGHVRVMAGGAALKQATAENLNVDFVAETAFDGLHFLERVREKAE